MIFFSEDQKTRNNEIKKINDYNQILKHTFDSFILDDNGRVFNTDCNEKITIGYHSGTVLDLHKRLCVPEGKMLKLSTKEIYKIIKEFKKELRGVGICKDNGVHFIDSTGSKLTIGKVLSDVEMDYILNKHKPFSDIESGVIISNSLSEDDIEDLVNKKVLEKDCNGYTMLITHKILPQVKKAKSVDVHINDMNKDIFIAIYVQDHDILSTKHFYKFLKI